MCGHLKFDRQLLYGVKRGHSSVLTCKDCAKTAATYKCGACTERKKEELSDVHVFGNAENTIDFVYASRASSVVSVLKTAKSICVKGARKVGAIYILKRIDSGMLRTERAPCAVESVSNAKKFYWVN